MEGGKVVLMGYLRAARRKESSGSRKEEERIKHGNFPDILKEYRKICMISIHIYQEIFLNVLF